MKSPSFPHFSKDDPPLLPHPPVQVTLLRRMKCRRQLTLKRLGLQTIHIQVLASAWTLLPKTWCYQGLPEHGRGIGPTEGDESPFSSFCFWPTTGRFTSECEKNMLIILMNGVGSPCTCDRSWGIQPRLSWVFPEICLAKNKQKSFFLWQESTMVRWVPNLEHSFAQWLICWVIVISSYMVGEG